MGGISLKETRCCFCAHLASVCVGQKKSTFRRFGRSSGFPTEVAVAIRMRGLLSVELMSGSSALVQRVNGRYVFTLILLMILLKLENNEHAS